MTTQGCVGAIEMGVIEPIGMHHQSDFETSRRRLPVQLSGTLKLPSLFHH